MAKTTTTDQAKDIIRELTMRWGHLPKEMMDDIGEWKPEYRRAIDESWLSLENAASHSVKTLAKEIYGSGARFVFELLQNADDNMYREAKRMKAAPAITFKVYESQIIVECNEDGFSKSDLNAICAVGQSTKSAKYGYIGAKGIGFKSVFVAAWKVYIQSGSFSFQFEHRKTDPGLGMVRPIWVDPTEVLPYPLTRMTLFLHDDETGPGNLKDIVFEQFKELQPTCLLFLKKLQRITIEHYQGDDTLSNSTTFTKTDIDQHRVRLDRTSISDGRESTRSQFYHITRQEASKLPLSAGRAPPSSEDLASPASTAEVILAFPLTEDYKPLCTDRQELFAFLPVRSHDYKFIIHSDFDTASSRQDIITTSKRNCSLRTWIATAFITAVHEFCEHATLCYDWPLFLPNDWHSSWDSFWAGLNSELRRQLTVTPVLKSRSSKQLRLIYDVRILPLEAQLDGEPLFNDETEDPYLSPHYTWQPRGILVNYGLRVQREDDLIDLLAMDIRSPSSRMYGDSSEQWHSAVALLFSSWLDKNLPETSRLRSIALLPLKGGGWVNARHMPVYFPSTRGIDIPEQLNLEVLNPLAVANADRRGLFERLGASEAEISTVRQSILRAFNESSFISMNIIKAYLHYLYLTHQPGSTSTELSRVWTVSESRKIYRALQTDVYLSSATGPYASKFLLSASPSTPGLPAEFTDAMYMAQVPQTPTMDHPTWERWLYDCIGIREHLRLISRDGKSLSDAFMYVLKHRPSSFMGLFEHLWAYEGDRLKDDPELRQQIREISAKDLCRVDYELCLKDTWLPLPNLMDAVTRYMEDSASFPFLKVDEAETDQLSPRWQFLRNHFSVGYKESLSFLLTILQRIKRAFPEPSISQIERIYRLYVAIASKAAVQQDSDSTTKRLKQFFSRGGIIVPYENGDEGGPTWATASECVWNGPADFISKHSLKSLYMRTLQDQDITYIEQLFHRTIEIPSASAADIVAELEERKDGGFGAGDEEVITELYKYLYSLQFSAKTLSPEFQQNALIMVASKGQTGWYKTSDTLWSSSAPIRGKVTLDTHYSDLKTLFVNKLGVKSLTLDMVYDELTEDPPSNSQEDIKVAMLSLSNFLRDERTFLRPDPVRRAKIFPVKYGDNEVVLRSGDAHFAIADRAHLEERFRGRVALLNFDLEELQQLRPFFFWVGLADRFLSNSVREITSVAPDSGRPLRVLNRELSRKAYYILRVAATFNSPRYSAGQHDLYELLRSAKTVETDEIHVTLQLSQDGHTVPIEDSSPNVHIDDIAQPLMVYVPRKKSSQAICFSCVLPRRLLWWLMDYRDNHIEDHDDSIAINALTSILTCDRHVLDDILDRLGIIELDTANQDLAGSGEVTEDEESAADGATDVRGDSATVVEESDTETLVETVARSRLARDTRTASSEPPLFHFTATQHHEQREPVQQALTERTPFQPLQGRLFSFTAPITNTTDDGRYRALLERVVTAAQAASFPSSGAFNLDSLRDALFSDAGDHALYGFDGVDVLPGFRSVNQLERDMKVGAAGELYVFELLSKLGLPGWSRRNWQSTIRNYAGALPQYSGIEPWPFSETADIVYHDEQGALTEVLIGCGYLTRDQWQSARPRYFLEVKTTTSQRETPFYMSGKQYRLMQAKHQSQDRSEVYIILRVFGLNSRRLGMCAYLDPEKLRKDGHLLFTGQTWSIIPGNGTPLENGST